MSTRTVGRNRRDDLSSRQWLALFVCLTALTGFASLLFAAGSMSAPKAELDPFQKTRIGRILMEDPDGKCERFRFDNLTGSIARDHGTCYRPPTDASERLSVISHAFSGK